MIYAKLRYVKSATARPGDRLNGFENGKTRLFNSWGVGKLAYFQKWCVALKEKNQLSYNVIEQQTS